MPSFRSLMLACLCACGHAGPAETTPVTTPVASAAPSATVSPSAAPSSSESASAEPSGVFCESQSPPMPSDPNDSRTSCWYAGTSCTGHGGDEGDHFNVAGAVVSGAFIHGGCNPGSYALVYEPSSSPLRVHVCAKRSPPTKCAAMVNDGAKWDTTLLLHANHATAVTIVKP